MLAPEALSMAFVNAAPEYLVVLDEQSRIVFANNAFRTSFLFDAEPAGVDFFSLVDAVSIPRGTDALVRVRSGADTDPEPTVAALRARRDLSVARLDG